MKAPTSNSLLQPFTLSDLKINQPARLYLITGKGGVGKTSFAMALTKKLEKEGKHVQYHSFDQPLNSKLASELELPALRLQFYESAENYVALKLGSKSIAKWIMKTPFFKSLLNILPGLNHLIFLGNIIYLLEKDPTLHVVIDSPSTGHAISILQSTHNFKKIFKTGLLVKDIERMHKYLYAEDFLKIFILTLPTLMSVEETKDLQEELMKMNYPSEVVYNDFISLNQSIRKEEKLPDFIERKIALETRLLGEQANDSSLRIPHISLQSKSELVKYLYQGNPT